MNVFFEGIKELYSVLGNTNIRNKYVKIKKNGIIYYFIVNPGMVEQILEKDNDKKFLSGLFNISNPYENTRIEVYVICFQANKQDKVKIGSYDERISYLHKIDSQNGGIPLPENYPYLYKLYLNQLYLWMNDNQMPNNLFADYSNKKEIAWFNTISFVEFENDFFRTYNPKFYKPSVVKLKKEIEKESIVHLIDVAEVLRPKEISEDEGWILTSNGFKYPLNRNEITKKGKTNYKLHKGDIVLTAQNKFYLFYENNNDDLYCSPFYYLIRPTSISPEYLFVYLQSEMFQIILNNLKNGMVPLRLKIVENLPIILPQRDDEYYQRCFELSFFSKDELSIYDEYFSNYSEGEILDLELIKKVHLAKEKTVMNLLKNDMEELNTCFKAGAYKATLILAGSILEAFLIDWLSEINGTNYFKEEYYVFDKRTNQKRRANLIDYIDSINEIERPEWIKEANMAHTIRQKRNLVHAKLGINSNEVNKNTCRMVIDYLKNIILKRAQITSKDRCADYSENSVY